jgi:indole-3-glycerol phosphate synthase
MSATHLDRLVASALEQMSERATRVPMREIRARAAAAAPPRDFVGALRKAKERARAVIAEVKRSSPSRGAIAPDLHPGRLAAAYERGGAACVSVLTDRVNFGGTLEDLAAARDACSLPVLRKDFLVTPYQLYEARAHGADAVLLIAAALQPRVLAELRELARELRLATLLEVHTEEDLDAARSAQPDLLGINARNLKTLVVRPHTFEQLAPQARDIAPLVAESGIRTAADARRYVELGADALLVGEALSGASDPEAAVRALVQG